MVKLVDVVEAIGGKRLPAVLNKNPNLYILASRDEKSMSVALANVNLDDILSPEIRLDKEYKEIKFVNCTGTLKGDKVYLDDITPYKFVAFEVK